MPGLITKSGWITKSEWAGIFTQYGITRQQFEQMQALWKDAPYWSNGLSFANFNPWVGDGEGGITTDKITLFLGSLGLQYVSHAHTLKDLRISVDIKFIDISQIIKKSKIQEMEF